LKCPFNCLTYKEFLNYYGFNFDKDKYLYEEDYSQYLLNENTEKLSFIPIRIDYEESQYREAQHPVCHIHMGYNN